MNQFYFNVETRIDNQELLRKIFQNDSICLNALSAISFYGQISLGSNVSFSGNCFIGPGSIIDDGVKLSNASIGSNCSVRPYSIIYDTQAGSDNVFGPFCFIRDNSHIKDNNIIGAHVELARSNISSNIKISHRAFIADASIQDYVIIGAGVIFCNYDGTKKCNSIIESNVSVGSGSLIISPVTIGRFSIIAAGSVVNKNIEANKKFIQKRDLLEI